MGVKRRERDLAGFEALVVCDGEVFCFFFPFSREIMTEPSVGVFVLDILIFFFLFFVIHLCLNMPTTSCHFLRATLYLWL